MQIDYRGFRIVAQYQKAKQHVIGKVPVVFTITRLQDDTLFAKGEHHWRGVTEIVTDCQAAVDLAFFLRDELHEQ